MALGPRLVPSRREQRKNMIGDVLPDECITPTGVYQIELKDKDTGKTQEIVKSNYISPSWANIAKIWQACLPTFWHHLPHNSTILSSQSSWPFVDDRTIHPFAMRPFPMSEIILTNSVEPENVNSHWLKGDIIAWASYWKTASIPASGRRGQINEAECLVSSNGQVQKRVWDWSTQQGNGVYQTLGIGLVNINQGIDTPVISVQVGPHTIIGPKKSTIDALMNASDMGAGASVNMINIRDMFITGGKCFLLVCTNTSAGATSFRNRLIYCNIPVGLASTDYDGSGLVFDLSGETWVNLQTGGNTTQASFPQMTTSSGGNVSHYYLYNRGLHCEGTTLYWIERNPTSTTRGPRIGKSSFATPAATTTTWFKDMGTDYGRTSNQGLNYTADICKIGTYLYVVVSDTSLSGGAGGEVWNGQVFRIVEATGALDATLPFPSGMFARGGICTDGTDMFIATNRGIVRMTPAGVVEENLGLPSSFNSGNSEYSLDPWNALNSSGTYAQILRGNGQGAMMWPSSNGVQWLRDENYYVQHGGYHFKAPFARNNYNDDHTDDWDTRFPIFWNDRLWFSGRYLSDSNVGETADPIYASLMGLTGANMFSRALLASEVTKTSSQTMKVSYELTLPDIDSWWHDHMAVV